MPMEENIKTQILDYSYGIYEEAFRANSYYLLTQQYRNISEKYSDEMDYSPSFYNVTYNALIDACTMSVARIFDADSKSANIEKLLHLWGKYMGIFPSKASRTYKNKDGKDCIQEQPFTHRFTQEEIELVRKSPKKFSDTLQSRIVDCEYDSTQLCGIIADMEKQDFLRLHKLKYKTLNKEIESLEEQRNKMYAHNDEAYNFDYRDVLDSYPLSFDGIQKLIDFALDVSIDIIRFLTHCMRTKESVDYHDLENTLETIKEYRHTILGEESEV